MARLHPDDRAGLDAAPGDRSDRFSGLKARWRDADGSWRWLLWSGVRTARRWHCVGKDITALKLTEQGLADREQRPELCCLPDGLCVVDGEGCLIWVSPALYEMTEFDTEELVGSEPPYGFCPDERHDEIAPACRAALAGEETRFQLVVCREGGERFPATTTASVLVNVDGHRPGCLQSDEVTATWTRRR